MAAQIPHDAGTGEKTGARARTIRERIDADRHRERFLRQRIAMMRQSADPDHRGIPD